VLQYGDKLQYNSFEVPHNQSEEPAVRTAAAPVILIVVLNECAPFKMGVG